AAAGQGAATGLPTVGANGQIPVNMHQVNTDGGGPFTCDVDATSGGTEESAFVPATVPANAAGLLGNSPQTQASDHQMTIQMPTGAPCSGTVAGVSNVCQVRCKNQAAAGPFGGSVAFTQEPAAKKRSIQELRLGKRHFARGIIKLRPEVLALEKRYDLTEPY
ncbi:MAG: hypothetical protein M1838_003903, partial [Thelocarpon superellum]